MEKDSGASGSDDLNKLLDSCLDDFKKPLAKIPPKEASTSTAKASSADNTQVSDSSAWGEEFKEFSDVMENLIGDESELNEFKKLMGNCLPQDAPALDDETLAKSIADTLREMTQQAQNVPETSPEDVANLFSNLGMGAGNNPDLTNLSEAMPLMQSLMHTLMSKDVLYPSIKEIVEKYPGWLDEKKSSLGTEELEKYQKQSELMKEICEEFEKEGVDTEEAKKAQFEKVLQLMQKVQNYGNPPKELIALNSLGTPPGVDENMQIPGMPEQCTIM